MIHPNTRFLREQFERDGALILAQMESFTINDKEFEKHLADLDKSSQEMPEIRRDRAVYRCLMHGKPSDRPTTLPPSVDPKLQSLLAQTGQLIEQQNGAIEALTAYREHSSLQLEQLQNSISGQGLRLSALIEKDVVDSQASSALLAFELSQVRQDIAESRESVREHMLCMQSDALHSKLSQRTLTIRGFQILAIINVLLFLIEIASR